MITIATVSPCYNEEEVLEHSAERLTLLFNRLINEKRISPESKIVFVNDGSRDKTWDIIKQLKEENPLVRGINLTRNVGHQNALMAGMMTARNWADAIISIDADLQDDLNAIPKMIDEVEKGYDIVYGVKVQRTADPLLKRLTAEAFYKMQSKLGVETIYNHADFRLLTRKALDILANYHEKNLYLRGLIPQIGLQSTTVDDVITEREAGKSKYSIAKMFGLATDGITSFSVKPLYAILYLGILFLIIAVIVAADAFYAMIQGRTQPGWMTLVLSIWLVGGFILTALGIVGVYIGKIYKEVKNRPLYNINEII